jgi:hypothetical protein
MGGYRMPRGYGSFLSGVSLLTWCIVGLLTVLVSWAIGGDDFKDSIYGNADIIVFLVGIGFGVWLVHWAQHHGHRSDDGAHLELRR